jgi:hypothetical protein
LPRLSNAAAIDILICATSSHVDNDPHKLPAEAGRREEERRKTDSNLSLYRFKKLQPQNKNKKRKQTKPQNLDSLQTGRIQVSEITPSEKTPA